MNINEAIEKIKALSYSTGIFFKNKEVSLDKVIEVVEQIDMQHKPVIVKKFVADWYEKHKDNLDYSLYLYMISVYEEVSEKNDFYYWMQKSNNPIQTIINMHQFGYEVEKEQLYTVEIPNPNENTSVYLYRTTKGCIAINTIYNNPDWKEFPQAKLTESEIKQDFEWAWDAEFAKPVSEEVER